MYVPSYITDSGDSAVVTHCGRRSGVVAANIVCGLTEFGRDTTDISQVRDEYDAEVVIDSIQRWNVDTSHIRRDDELPSHVNVFRGPEGDRMIIAGGILYRNFALPYPIDCNHTDCFCCLYRRSRRMTRGLTSRRFTSAYAPDQGGD